MDDAHGTSARFGSPISPSRPSPAIGPRRCVDIVSRQAASRACQDPGNAVGWLEIRHDGRRGRRSGRLLRAYRAAPDRRETDRRGRAQGNGPRDPLLVLRIAFDELVHNGLAAAIPATMLSPNMNTVTEIKTSGATHCSC